MRPLRGDSLRVCSMQQLTRSNIASDVGLRGCTDDSSLAAQVNVGGSARRQQCAAQHCDPTRFLHPACAEAEFETFCERSMCAAMTRVLWSCLELVCNTLTSRCTLCRLESNPNGKKMIGTQRNP